MTKSNFRFTLLGMFLASFCIMFGRFIGTTLVPSHIHDFTKWEPMTTPAYIPTMWASETMFPRQYRTCRDCGLAESRIVK